MADPMPEQNLEPDTIEYYPQPNDRCECGHLEKDHRGRICWGEDCGCDGFEIDPPLKKAPFVYYTPAANR